ncbi:tail assembly protein [Enterobacter wuhouensis]|uniref:tail assembly protein n=1 Tax=Enterobacter wuhouensis TaxID=2529381 RepID=UPI002FD77900
MSELVAVQLGGALARNFGKHWNLSVRNAKEAIDLIDANKPGFRNWMRRHAQTYDKYHIQITTKSGHKRSVDETEYAMAGGSNDVQKIRITPIPKGSGSKVGGILQVVVGVVLIIVGIVSSTYGGAPMIAAGVGMLAGGIINLLSPQPKNPSLNNADNKNSFYFDGPENTTAQGNPVQLIYGEEVLVGSQIVSSSVTIDQLMTDKTHPVEITPNKPVV